MGDWQPIDSAPKDGTRILAAAGDAIAVMVFYRFSMVRPRGAGYGGWALADEKGEALHIPEVGLADFIFEPTHWLPLPPPPAPHREDGNG